MSDRLGAGSWRRVNGEETGRFWGREERERMCAGLICPSYVKMNGGEVDKTGSPVIVLSSLEASPQTFLIWYPGNLLCTGGMDGRAWVEALER